MTKLLKCKIKKGKIKLSYFENKAIYDQILRELKISKINFN